MEEMRIDVIDNFIDPRDLHHMCKYSRNELSWNIEEYDIYEEQKYLSGMSANLDTHMREKLDDKILMQAKEILGVDLSIKRCYINAWKSNENSFPHYDACHTTCLIYMNIDYDVRYGGETLFYDDNKDAVYAISPQAGRAVFFDGMIIHRATSFNNLYKGYRHTIAYKLIEDGVKYA